jgi:flagellar biosynthesis protein FliQ
MPQKLPPFVDISIAVGLVISVFQAATQVNEQTITFVPKIIAIAIVSRARPLDDDYPCRFFTAL